MRLTVYIMITLTLTACIRHMPHTEPAMPIDSQGIPQRQYLVGDARDIDFQAPEDGTVFVVEQTSRTLIASQRIEQGQHLEQSEATLDEATMADHLNIEPDELRLWLYFIPAHDLDRLRESETRNTEHHPMLAQLTNGIQTLPAIHLELDPPSHNNPAALAGVLELDRHTHDDLADSAEPWRLQLDDGREAELIVRRNLGADIAGTPLLLFTTTPPTP